MDNNDCKVLKLSNKEVIEIIEHIAGVDLQDELNGNCKFQIFRFEKLKEVCVDIITKTINMNLAFKDDKFTSQVSGGYINKFGQKDIITSNAQQKYLEKLNQIIEAKNNTAQEETVIDL